MGLFLLKTEPSEYSFDDLVRDKKTCWAGVSNAAALIAIRSMRKGDRAFIYHTGDEKAIVGMAEVASGPYEDPERPGLTAEGLPKFAVVDLKAGKKVKSPVTLERIKGDKRFAEFALVKQSRLSVMAVPPALEKVLREWAGV
jgi:predicted RNA-binding protein with PUA-like domain